MPSASAYQGEYWLLSVRETGQGHLQLTHRELSRPLQIGKLPACYCWLVTPTAPEKNRIALLTAWLRKQFPGPLPRIRVNIDKE